MKSSLRVAAACALTLGLQVQADAAGGRAFTPTDLNTLARVSDPQVSPNNRYVVYVQRETDLEANRGRNDLWMVDLEAKPLKPRRLTQHSANDTNPRWSVDGTSIYFLSTRGGSSQIWRLSMSGGEGVQIIGPGRNDTVKAPEGYLSGWPRVVNECLDRIGRGDPPPATARDCAKAVQLIFDAYKMAGEV